MFCAIHGSNSKSPIYIARDIPKSSHAGRENFIHHFTFEAGRKANLHILLLFGIFEIYNEGRAG